MLNPEVVNFPAPESRVSYSQHTWNDMSSDDSWHQVIDDHPFNTKVSLLLPDTPTLPQIIHDAVADDGEFYLVRNLPLLELCSPTFLQAFVKTGCLNAVSCDTRLDVDNTAALTSDGLLHLILNKFTYQELRLNGSLSSHILRKPLEKYVVEVNMQKQCFKPGKAYYERVITAFTEVQLRFNFWLTWIPDNAEICPSSVAKYFHDLGYSIEEQHPCLNWNIVREAAMPLLCTASEEDPQDVLEWIGCQTLGVKMMRATLVVSRLPSTRQLPGKQKVQQYVRWSLQSQMFLLITCMYCSVLVFFPQLIYRSYSSKSGCG
ncbi:ribonuclease P protein subunit p40 isoform X2 [Procambarus clarkii]|uniref:ribonuclease P protein subunit p40 isoform X2 n=1 Tax=Procambarus clarkii TaxID=6728 RepID=UPI003741EE90